MSRILSRAGAVSGVADPRVFCDHCGLQFRHAGELHEVDGRRLCVDRSHCERRYEAYLRFRAVLAGRVLARAERLAE